jgi:hypothetical protein
MIPLKGVEMSSCPEKPILVLQLVRSPNREELSPIFGDGLKDQAAVVWD